MTQYFLGIRAGRIPPELGQLHRLQRLRLAKNRLEGTVQGFSEFEHGEDRAKNIPCNSHEAIMSSCYHGAAELIFQGVNASRSLR